MDEQVLLPMAADEVAVRLPEQSANVDTRVAQAAQRRSVLAECAKQVGGIVLAFIVGFILGFTLHDKCDVYADTGGSFR